MRSQGAQSAGLALLLAVIGFQVRPALQAAHERAQQAVQAAWHMWAGARQQRHTLHRPAAAASRQPQCLPPAALRSLQAACAAAAAAPSATAAAPLRFWIDEFFFATGETALLREAIDASGGAAVLAGATRNRVMQLKSYQLAHKADVLWTGRAVS